MNILILSGRFGMGHIKCTEAVRERLLIKYPSAEIIISDISELLFPRASKAIYDGYGLLCGFVPGIYNSVNRLATRGGSLPMEKFALRKIDELVRDFRPDIVISCLSTCCRLFSSYKREYGADIPLYSFLTDIPAHRLWVSDETDRYFVGSERTRRELLDMGVAPEKIRVCGIPVSAGFSAGNGSAKRESEYKVLVMGGGLGLVPGGRRLLESLDALSRSGRVEVTLAAGKNRKLAKKARAKYGNIRVLGYTDEIPSLMRGADILISKPGGVSTFEAINCGTALLVPRPRLKQELGNAAFIENNGIGRVVYDNTGLSPNDILSLLKDSDAREAMSENMRRLRSSYEDISIA